MGDMITKDEIIDDLNLQIERALETQIELSRKNSELDRQVKVLEYAVNGFLKDGLNFIQNVTIKKLNEYFSLKGVMDVKALARRKSDNREFLIFDEDLFNHEDGRRNYVLFTDTDYTPQVMHYETFISQFDIYKHLKGVDKT